MSGQRSRTAGSRTPGLHHAPISDAANWSSCFEANNGHTHEGASLPFVQYLPERVGGI